MEANVDELRPAPIRETIAKLEVRIGERFPNSGLRRVGAELIEVAAETDQSIQQMQQPLWWLRGLIAVAIVGLVATAGWVTYSFLKLTTGKSSVSDVMQTAEAGLNELIFLTIALLFLFTAETRVKRRKALRMLHRLRSLAHIVDMHQLTKDPEYAIHKGKPTASSPKRTMTRFELARYLNYCSEMLALVSKLAALHAQHLNDHVLLRAVNDVESLSAGLSDQIWQKIMILDAAPDGADETGPGAEKATE